MAAWPRLAGRQPALDELCKGGAGCAISASSAPLLRAIREGEQHAADALQERCRAAPIRIEEVPPSVQAALHGGSIPYHLFSHEFFHRDNPLQLGQSKERQAARDIVRTATARQQQLQALAHVAVVLRPVMRDSDKHRAMTERRDKRFAGAGSEANRLEFRAYMSRVGNARHAAIVGSDSHALLELLAAGLVEVHPISNLAAVEAVLTVPGAAVEIRLGHVLGPATSLSAARFGHLMALGGGQHTHGETGTDFMELFGLLTATCDMSKEEVDAVQRLMAGVKARYGSGDKRLDCKTFSDVSCIIHSGRQMAKTSTGDATISGMTFPNYVLFACCCVRNHTLQALSFGRRTATEVVCTLTYTTAHKLYQIGRAVKQAGASGMRLFHAVDGNAPLLLALAAHDPKAMRTLDFMHALVWSKHVPVQVKVDFVGVLEGRDGEELWRLPGVTSSSMLLLQRMAQFHVFQQAMQTFLPMQQQLHALLPAGVEGTRAALFPLGTPQRIVGYTTAVVKAMAEAKPYHLLPHEQALVDFLGCATPRMLYMHPSLVGGVHPSDPHAEGLAEVAAGAAAAAAAAVAGLMEMRHWELYKSALRADLTVEACDTWRQRPDVAAHVAALEERVRAAVGMEDDVALSAGTVSLDEWCRVPAANEFHKKWDGLAKDKFAMAALRTRGWSEEDIRQQQRWDAKARKEAEMEAARGAAAAASCRTAAPFINAVEHALQVVLQAVPHIRLDASIPGLARAVTGALLSAPAAVQAGGQVPLANMQAALQPFLEEDTTPRQLEGGSATWLDKAIADAAELEGLDTANAWSQREGLDMAWVLEAAEEHSGIRYPAAAAMLVPPVQERKRGGSDGAAAASSKRGRRGGAAGSSRVSAGPLRDSQEVASGSGAS